MVRPARVRGPAALGIAAVLAACASPVVKPEAFDGEVFARAQAHGGLIVPAMDGEEWVVGDSLEWMRLRPDHLTFVGYRAEPDRKVYGVVLDCVPARDLLAILPLAEGETPLQALADAPRRQALLQAVLDHRAAPGRTQGAVELSLRQAIAEKRLGPPIPDPRRVLAVAANYPSHLRADLDTGADQIAAIAKTPPRLFQKHPPLPPPGTEMPSGLPFRGVIGPFDPIVYPELTWLPKDESGVSNAVPTALDYEVELGIVIGRRLTWEEVAVASDEDLYRAIAGYVLVSDVKARNPQVYERALSRDESPAVWSARYLTGDADTDLILGNWNEATCAWWGYAASLGDFTAVGPYFVAANGEPAMPSHDLICARTYGTGRERDYAIPGDRSPDRFYLRQCSRATEEPGATDRMLWRIPQILRAALDPTGALAPTAEQNVLLPGDVIALGTPGGIVLTVAGRSLYRALDNVLFWWDARSWHDAFFAKDNANYLHNGDALFLWGEGLGCQRMPIQRIVWPPPPGVVPEQAVKG